MITALATQTKVDELLSTLGVTFDFKYVGTTDDPKWHGASQWETSFRADGVKATFDYHTGQAITDNPCATDVLYSVLSDAQAINSTFEEWCDEFGYDEDSRKAYSTWEECRANGFVLGTLLTVEDRDAISELLEDY